MANNNSADSSPIEDTDLEKMNLDSSSQRGRQESEVDDIESSQERTQLKPPLHQVRSHSSARSQRSYTDGYTHSYHDGEEKQQQSPDQLPDPSKEFEVTMDGDSDPWNPKNRSHLRKWSIVLIGSACSLCVTCASALYTSTYEQLERDFEVSRLVATIGLTTYVCGLGLGPMFLGPLSEFYGRRYIFVVSFGMFFIWLIPCALAQNIQTMLLVRFFDGLAGSAFLSVAGGTVGDMFTKDELSAPMMVYTASPFCGPELGPIVGYESLVCC